MESEGCDDQDQFLLPFVNATTALNVFEYLREHKIGEELREMTMFAGDWSGPWDGPLYIPPWIEGRKTEVVCTAEGTIKCSVEVGENYWIVPPPKPWPSWRDR
jgi:hypothetical protein